MQFCPACGVDEKTHKNLDCINALRSEIDRVSADAKRYQYIKDHHEWRRVGKLADDDSHAFVGCRFPYIANFECAAMLDYNIDKMIESET